MLAVKGLCVVLLAQSALRIAAEITKDSNEVDLPHPEYRTSPKGHSMVHRVRRSDLETERKETEKSGVKPNHSGGFLGGLFNWLTNRNPDAKDHQDGKQRHSLIDFQLNIEGGRGAKKSPTKGDEYGKKSGLKDKTAPVKSSPAAEVSGKFPSNRNDVNALLASDGASSSKDAPLTKGSKHVTPDGKPTKDTSHLDEDIESSIEESETTDQKRKLLERLLNIDDKDTSNNSQSEEENGNIKPKTNTPSDQLGLARGASSGETSNDDSFEENVQNGDIKRSPINKQRSNVDKSSNGRPEGNVRNGNEKQNNIDKTPVNQPRSSSDDKSEENESHGNEKRNPYNGKSFNHLKPIKGESYEEIERDEQGNRSPSAEDYGNYLNIEFGGRKFGKKKQPASDIKTTSRPSSARKSLRDELQAPKAIEDNLDSLSKGPLTENSTGKDDKDVDEQGFEPNLSLYGDLNSLLPVKSSSKNKLKGSEPSEFSNKKSDRGNKVNPNRNVGGINSNKENPSGESNADNSSESSSDEYGYVNFYFGANGQPRRENLGKNPQSQGNNEKKDPGNTSKRNWQSNYPYGKNSLQNDSDRSNKKTPALDQDEISGGDLKSLLSIGYQPGESRETNHKSRKGSDSETLTDSDEEPNLKNKGKHTDDLSKPKTHQGSKGNRREDSFKPKSRQGPQIYGEIGFNYSPGSGKGKAGENKSRYSPSSRESNEFSNNVPKQGNAGSIKKSESKFSDQNTPGSRFNFANGPANMASLRSPGKSNEHVSDGPNQKHKNVHTSPVSVPTSTQKQSNLRTLKEKGNLKSLLDLNDSGENSVESSEIAGNIYELPFSSYSLPNGKKHDAGKHLNSLKNDKGIPNENKGDDKSLSSYKVLSKPNDKLFQSHSNLKFGPKDSSDYKSTGNALKNSQKPSDINWEAKFSHRREYKPEYEISRDKVNNFGPDFLLEALLDIGLPTGSSSLQNSDSSVELDFETPSRSYGNNPKEGKLNPGNENLDFGSFERKNGERNSKSGDLSSLLEIDGIYRPTRVRKLNPSRANEQTYKPGKSRTSGTKEESVKETSSSYPGSSDLDRITGYDRDIRKNPGWSGEFEFGFSSNPQLRNPENVPQSNNRNEHIPGSFDSQSPNYRENLNDYDSSETNSIVRNRIPSLLSLLDINRFGSGRGRPDKGASEKEYPDNGFSTEERKVIESNNLSPVNDEKSDDITKNYNKDEKSPINDRANLGSQVHAAPYLPNEFILRELPGFKSHDNGAGGKDGKGGDDEKPLNENTNYSWFKGRYEYGTPNNDDGNWNSWSDGKFNNGNFGSPEQSQSGKHERTSSDRAHGLSGKWEPGKNFDEYLNSGFSSENNNWSQNPEDSGSGSFSKDGKSYSWSWRTSSSKYSSNPPGSWSEEDEINRGGEPWSSPGDDYFNKNFGQSPFSEVLPSGEDSYDYRDGEPWSEKNGYFYLNFGKSPFSDAPPSEEDSYDNENNWLPDSSGNRIEKFPFKSSLWGSPENRHTNAGKTRHVPDSSSSWQSYWYSRSYQGHESNPRNDAIDWNDGGEYFGSGWDKGEEMDNPWGLNLPFDQLNGQQERDNEDGIKGLPSGKGIYVPREQISKTYTNEELNSSPGDRENANSDPYSANAASPGKNFAWNFNLSGTKDKSGNGEPVKSNKPSLGDTSSPKPQDGANGGKSASNPVTHLTTNFTSSIRDDAPPNEWTISAKANLTNLGNAVLDNIRNGIANARSTLTDFAGQTAKNAIRASSNAVKAAAQMGQRGLQWGKGFFSWVKDAGQKAYDAGKNAVQAAVNGAKNLAKNGMEGIKNLGGAAASGLQKLHDMADRGADGLTGAVDNAVNTVKNSEVPFAGVFEAGKKLTRNLVAEAKIKLNDQGPTDFSFNIGGSHTNDK